MSSLLKPSNLLPDLSFLKCEDRYLVAGVDEAGRGAIAGPVFAAVVVFPANVISNSLFSKITDSKAISPQKRKVLFNYIIQTAVDFAIGYSEVSEINQVGIFKATFKAMASAIEKLKVKPDIVLVDGPHPIPYYKGIQKSIVKGDKFLIPISAASILAKVARDEYMKVLSKSYPEYQFDKHKGYATKLHFKLIEKFGLSPAHRTYYTCLKKHKGKTSHD